MGYNISYGVATPRSVGTLDYKSVTNAAAESRIARHAYIVITS
jgi:hypothetical protein